MPYSVQKVARSELASIPQGSTLRVHQDQVEKVEKVNVKRGFFISKTEKNFFLCIYIQNTHPPNAISHTLSVRFRKALACQSTAMSHPCKKSHGKDYRRSPKGPYYACIKRRAKQRLLHAHLFPKHTRPLPRSTRDQKVFGAKEAQQLCFQDHRGDQKVFGTKRFRFQYAKISSAMKLPIGSKFTTRPGTYKRVSKNESSKGFVKLM